MIVLVCWEGLGCDERDLGVIDRIALTSCPLGAFVRALCSDDCVGISS